MVEQDGIPPIKYVDTPNRGSFAIRDVDMFTVEEGTYFLMGDNSENSYDSRSFGNLVHLKN